MTAGSDNVFPKIITAVQSTDIAAPSDGSWKLYSKPGGVYARSSNAIVGPFAAASVGSYVSGELDYVAATSSVNLTATTEGTANTIVTGSAVTYDGSTIVQIEFVCTAVNTTSGAANHYAQIWLYDGASSIGEIAFVQGTGGAGGGIYMSVHGARRLTPSAATHTYSIRGSVDSGTGVAAAGTGGVGTVMPMYIRITKV